MAFQAIQNLIENINLAPTPRHAARVAVDWLVEHVGPAVIGLLTDDDEQVQVIVNESNAPEAMILTWVRSDTDWHTLASPGETADGDAMLIPLRYGERMYGILWQQVDGADQQHTVQMLMGMLSTHIHHLLSRNSDREMSEVVDTLARQTARLSAATSVSRVIIANKEIRPMLYSVTELICYRFGYASVEVMLLTEDKQALTAAMIYTEDGPLDFDPDYELPLSEKALSTWAINMAERVVANDVRTHPYFRQNYESVRVRSQIAVPMRSGMQMQGALIVSSSELNAFDAPDVEMMQSIADQLAVGITNARLFSEVHARAQDLSALTEISLLVNATLDLEHLAQRVYNAFERLQKPDVFQFVVFDRFSNDLQVETYENGVHHSQRLPFDASDNLISQIIEQTTPVFWRNEQERETAGTFFRVEQANHTSFLGVPMMAKESVVGVLCSHSNRPNAFSEHALQVMLTFASSVAVAIDNAELFSYTARRVQELAMINEISHLLARSFGQDDFWSLIHRQIASLFENSALFVALHDRQQDFLTFPLVSDESTALLPQEPILRRGGLCDAVLRENSMVLFADLTAEKQRMEMMGILPQPDEPGYDKRSWLGVPLQNAEGEVIGVVGVNSNAPGQYDDQDSSLLMTVTAQLSLSLQNAQLLHAEQKRRQISGTLIDVGRIVANTLQIDEVLPLVLEQMERVVSFDTASILLVVPDAEEDLGYVEVSAVRGPAFFSVGRRLRFFEGSAIAELHNTQKPVVIRNTELHPTWNAFDRLDELGPEQVTGSWLGVPMITQGRTIGYISMGKAEANHFTEKDGDTAFAMARQAAIAVNNARLYTSELERRQIADSLFDVGHAVASSLELEEVLDRILEAIQIIVSYDGATVMLQAEGVHDASEMVIRAMRGDIAAHSGMRIFFNEESLNTKVFRSRQPIVVDDVQASAAFNGIHENGRREEKTRSWICVPMLVQDRFLGFINIDKFEPGYYTRRDADTVFALARQAAVAVDNARLFKAEQERRRVANSLIDVSRIVAATLDQDRVLTLILAQMQRVVNFDAATIQLNVPGVMDGSQVLIHARRGSVGADAGTLITYHEGHPIRTIYNKQKPIIIEDIREEPGWFNYDVDRRIELTPIRGWLGVPMIIQDRIIGVLTLDKFEEDYYTERDADTVFALARQAAVAVENASLHQNQKQALYTLQMRARRLATLHRIATVVSSTLDRNEIIVAASDLLLELFDANGCMIAQAVNDGDSMYVAHSTHDFNEFQVVFMVGSALHDEMMEQRRVMQVEVTPENVRDPLARLIQLSGMQSLLIAPLVVKERSIGIIGLDVQHRDVPFDDEEIQTYAAIAQQVAVAMYNAELYEEALIANRLKSQFLANISHELRTPLNAIIGYTEMTVEGLYGGLNDQQNDRLARVLHSGQHLLALISDVLDLSKIEAGQMELDLMDINLQSILNNSLVFITPQVEEKELSLELSFNGNAPQIHVDAGRIQQVITNLLSNAVKFTDEGQVIVATDVVRVEDGVSNTLEIPEKQEVEDGTWLAVCVTDTGIGISEEHQKFIFDAFRQADGSAARKHQGTGLGLAIAREIVLLHGGHIWVCSEIDKGSTFTVLLPIPESETALPASLFESAVGSERHPTILVIDDDTGSLQMLQDYLTRENFRVVCTNNPIHGLRLAEERQPAAVLLDLDMPQMNGLEVLERLQTDPGTNHIPVVMISIMEQRAEASRLGASAYMVKPLDRAELVTLLHNVISGSPAPP